MPVSKDISCNIRIGGSALQEYNDGGNDQSESVIKTVYIEAQESATFSIFCEVLSSYKPTIGDHVSFYAYVGGKKYCRRSVAVKNHKAIELQGSYGINSLGIQFVHPFQFAGVSLVEDHESDVRVDPNSLALMDEISVYVCRSRKAPGRKRRPKAHAATEMASIEKVNEKALKGRDLTHVTKLGPRKVLGQIYSVSKSIKYDSIQEPFIHFRFLYRSKGALQNLGFIPFDSILPFGIEGSISTTAREILLEKEIASLRAELESRDRALKRETKEEGSPQPKRSKLLNVGRVVETIDLTGVD